MRTVPILASAALLLAGCGSSGPPVVTGGVVQVVAAENFWGSIAAQVGGAHAHVVSVIANPNTDPHAYEPTPQDARTVAQSDYVILNGAGYDPWMQSLVDADAVDPHLTLDVAALAGRHNGDNPHMWYSPSIVMQVVSRIGADLARIDAADAAYFTRQAQDFATSALARYDTLRSSIRNADAGTPVGATESIVVDLAADLHLRLVTPDGYMKAISEGDEPSPQDKSTVDAQVAHRSIRVHIYNRQNATPDVQALVGTARSQRIPVVAVTETLDPAGATFQDWQASQLSALQQALQQAAA